MATIHLDGERLYLDDDIATAVESMKWKRQGKEGHTIRRSYWQEGKVHTQSLQEFITGEKAGQGFVWFHIDENWRNFRRENLILKPRGHHLETQQFQEGDPKARTNRKRNGQYVGVYKSGNKFKALVTINGKQEYLGLHPDQKTAAEAYDRALTDQGLPPINFPA